MYSSCLPHPMTILIGSCPEKRLSRVAPRLFQGIVQLLQLDLPIGNFKFRVRALWNDTVWQDLQPE